jgi:hypothetical protein
MLVDRNSSVPPEKTRSIWQKARKAIGRAWKSIMHLPSKMIELIGRISKAVSHIFSRAPEKPQSDRPIQAKALPTDPSKTSDDEDEEDLDLTWLFGSEKATPPKKDPLVGMGAVALDESVLVAGLPLDPLSEEQLFSDEYLLIQGVMEPARQLLQGLRKHPEMVDEIDSATRELGGEYETLRQFAEEFEPKSLAKRELVRVMAEIEEQMADLGMSFVLGIQDRFQEIDSKKPATIAEYWSSTQELGVVFEELRPFASRFEVSAPGVHELVQGLISSIEQKKSLLDEAFSDQVQGRLKPNPGIRPLGNCLFESIGHQLGRQKDYMKLRRQAVAYLREYLDEYRDGLRDAMTTPQATGSMARYAHSKKGKWEQELTDKLGRNPDLVDRYLDCMENHALWGGTNEIKALSQVLQRPIMVFTNQDGGLWRLDLVAGQSMLADKKPLMLYYNGTDHYQDLISK